MISRLELWDQAGRLAFLPAASSVRIREVLNGEYFVSFEHPKSPGSDERYTGLITDNEIRFPSDIEGGQRFVIKHESGGRKDKVKKNLEAHHIAITFGQYFFDSYIDFAAAQLPGPLLTQLFAGTPFNYTVNGVFSPQDIFDWGEKSRLACLYDLCEVFGAELTFNNQSITFSTRRGADNGEQIRYRKNLKGIERTVHTMDRVTRLYGYGKDGLTIEGMSGHATKYIDSSYYDSQRPYEAKQEWPDIDDQGRLLAAMQKYLSENELPKVSYEVDLVDLFKAGIAVGFIGVGDTVRVIDEELGFDFNTRVLEYERYPFEPQHPRLVLGNFQDRGMSDYMLTYRRKQREIEATLSRRAAELDLQQAQLAQAQTDLSNYIDGAFKDGVITIAEAQAIAEHKLQLANERADVDAEYANVYNNTYFTNATLKSALGSGKTNYDTAYTALISAIDTAIADSSITSTERNNVTAKFTDLNGKLALLRQALQNSWAFISQTAVDKVAGQGIVSGGIISIQNRTQTVIKTTLTQAVTGTAATVINVASTASFDASGIAYASSASGSDITDFNYTGKTATSFTGVSGLDVTLPLPASAYLFSRPQGDIVVSAMEVIMPDGKYLTIPETRFAAQILGAGFSDFDGWEFRYLYVDSGGVVRLTNAGTSGGWTAYPPNPPTGSIRIGYILIGFGKEDPDGGLNSSKDFGTDGFPVFKEKIYHDVRYRDERAIRAVAGDIAYGGVPYGAQTLAVSAAAGTYQTYYVQIGAGRRSVNLSLSLDDGSGYDNYTYGAQLTVGRKAANNADGLGRSLWATYVDVDNVRGHVNGQRNLSPYGVHVLSPRVWNKTYTMLFDVDLTPDPNNGGVIAFKLTFRNYSGSVSESFNLKLNWHAL
ncbi:phage tail protein [Paenibacillus sp. OV219]|uniref:phage tail protein n=1 Tax=Paenibacillus sp. OV219 TaxID=1884377 RepID=UPI0008C7EF5C|nr:phage tail protein [Paenibacillus sp. OV219]SEM82157.1 phage minor structural protein, N-terminal region [Paenibacillus sp. OV219]